VTCTGKRAASVARVLCDTRDRGPCRLRPARSRLPPQLGNACSRCRGPVRRARERAPRRGRSTLPLRPEHAAPGAPNRSNGSTRATPSPRPWNCCPIEIETPRLRSGSVRANRRPSRMGTNPAGHGWGRASARAERARRAAWAARARAPPRRGDHRSNRPAAPRTCCPIEIETAQLHSCSVRAGRYRSRRYRSRRYRSRMGTNPTVHRVGGERAGRG
jgi:hypothetical protein